MGLVLVASVTLLLNTAALPAHAAWDPLPILSTFKQALEQKGLMFRDDITITLSDSPVAAGFSRLDCPGTLIVAPMPNTAQGWGHMAPLLNLDAFEVAYLYQGVYYDKPPVFDRFYDSAKVLFSGHSLSKKQVIHAVAETGSCGLAATALNVISEI